MNRKNWWFVAAGVVCFAKWWSKLEPHAERAREMPPGYDEWDGGAARVSAALTHPRSRKRRFATSLAFVTLFFAGAAFTAAAGSQVVSTDEANVAATASDAPAADQPAAAQPAAAQPAEQPAATSEAAPAPAEAPVPEPQPAATGTTAVAAAAPATEADISTAAPSADDVAIAAAPARVDDTATPVASPDATTAVVTPAAAPAPVKHTTARRAARVQHEQRSLESKPVLFPAVHFVPALPFDVHAWVHANPGSPMGAAALAIASHFIGTPYVWGGSTPSGGFDCSGLMMYVYAQLGVTLPHYAAAQFAVFPHLVPSELQPGDLVFFEPKADGPGHVAMYAGGDSIIEAPHTGALVRVGSLSGSAWSLGFLGAIRPYGRVDSSARKLASARAHASGIGTASSVFAV